MDDSDLDSLRDDPRFMALLEREPVDWQERIMAAVEELRAYFAEHGPEIIARLQVVAQEVMTAVQEALAQLQNGGARPSSVEAEELVIERPQQQQQQERAQKPQRQQALATVPDLDSLMADQRWKEASRLLREVVREDPDNGRAWFMLGYSLHADGQLDEAIEAHKRASTFEEFKGIALYNLGCAYALQGNKQRAYGALRRSHDAGFDVLEHIEDDSDLESLRRDRRYRDFLAELKDPGSF